MTDALIILTVYLVVHFLLSVLMTGAFIWLTIKFGGVGEEPSSSGEDNTEK